MTYDDLPLVIPIFPLDVLLLPGGLLPLNIFEEKYVRMIDDALGSHRIIGIVQADEAKRQKGQTNAIYKTGCAGRIMQFSERDDNRYMIMLKGLSRFEVKQEMTNILPYRQARADWKPYSDDIVEDCDTIEIDRDMFIPLLESYLKKNDLRVDSGVLNDTPCEMLITALPMICPFKSQEKRALLEAQTLQDRYHTLTTLLQIELNEHDDGANISKLKH
jgi:Lon protease-like protein